MENDFLLLYVDASWKFLDHHAAFRFQVGQLVAQDRVAGYFSVAYGQNPDKKWPKWLFFEKIMAKITTCFNHRRTGRRFTEGAEKIFPENNNLP